MNTKTIDLTETNVNIDNLLDVYIQTQKENGVDVGMVEIDVTIDDNGKVIRDKFGHHQREEPKKSCDTCHASCEKKDPPKKTDNIPWYLKNNMGLFGEDASDELETEEVGDDKYICEFCSEIGYKKEYKAYICDTCRACETCTEYDSQDCDGCSYSMYRTGELYSRELAKKGDQSYLEKDEQDLIASIELRSFDGAIRDADSKFTIMNYDHTYSD